MVQTETASGMHPMLRRFCVKAAHHNKSVPILFHDISSQNDGTYSHSALLLFQALRSVQRLTEFIHYICDQVKAFLICQTGNDSDQHRIRVFIQSKIFLKLDLILNFFLTESLCIVVSGNTFICFRIEYIIINSIDNTSKIMCSGTEKTIQTFSIERSFDFFRISITYCSYCISKNNSTFQKFASLYASSLSGAK